MECVPVLSFYEIEGKQAEYSELEKHFKSKYNHLPNFYARASGRVNLIGEHIDYCGFSVLPMAIQQDVVVAVGFNNTATLNLTNKESDLYEDFTTSTTSIIIDQLEPKWYHYFLCGFKGITELHSMSPRGLDVAVQGTIPPSSGLSSSSALVCAAALVTAHAHRMSLSKMKIASICASCERYIGTEGGGMDQAISFLAEPGSAKFIEFNPLKAIDVPLPRGASFVVSNSCVPMNKAATSHFNIRVVECKLAAKVLAETYEQDHHTIDKLKDLVDVLDVPLYVLCSELKERLHEEPYTRLEICELLDITQEQLKSDYLSKNTQNLEEFKLYQRALHVFGEATRVLQFKFICESNMDNALRELGKLMNESHQSCRDLYECSHPQLDELVKISINVGALGSRLTGAGWGGCAISLVANDDVNSFINEVKEKFYMKDPDRRKMMKVSLFVTQPGGGAAVYTL